MSDAALWSLVDRDGGALDGHLEQHPEDRSRAEALRSAVAAVRAGLTGDGPVPRIPGYRLEGVLGRGGMGVVYSAEQEHPPRRVAIKVLRRSSLDGRGAARFRREVAALARLEHSHIATILDAGTTEDGAPWYSMRLVRGRPFVEHARSEGLDRRSVLELFVALCEAVEFAHRSGVVHRDLKPANVLIDPESGPVVLDFGLARLREDTERTIVTESGNGSFLGTLAYMAPEQARGEGRTVGERSDVYALGAILHELLLGRTPHDLAGRTLVESARLVAEQNPPRPRSLDAALELDLQTILEKALEREPGRRYASARELGLDVRRYLAGEPILARAWSPGYRVLRFLARHRIGVLALGSVLVFALLALASTAFRFRLFQLGGDWWREGAPFDELRWNDGAPEVLVEGRWYELLAIDGLRVAYIGGFARQAAGELWRKRFSEDLVQVLNQMGDWCWWQVELELRNLETGEVIEKAANLSKENRTRIYRDRYAWPFESPAPKQGRWPVEYQGKTWQLVSVADHSVEELDPFLAQTDLDLSDLYDLIVDATGYSPPPTIDFELRDVASGEVQRFVDVPRDERQRQ